MKETFKINPFDVDYNSYINEKIINIFTDSELSIFNIISKFENGATLKQICKLSKIDIPELIINLVTISRKGYLKRCYYFNEKILSNEEILDLMQKNPIYFHSNDIELRYMAIIK